VQANPLAKVPQPPSWQERMRMGQQVTGTGSHLLAGATHVMGIWWGAAWHCPHKQSAAAAPRLQSVAGHLVTHSQMWASMCTHPPTHPVANGQRPCTVQQLGQWQRLPAGFPCSL
jgi:hypothetical protein